MTNRWRLRREFLSLLLFSLWFPRTFIILFFASLRLIKTVFILFLLFLFVTEVNPKPRSCNTLRHEKTVTELRGKKKKVARGEKGKSEEKQKGPLSASLFASAFHLAALWASSSSAGSHWAPHAPTGGLPESARDKLPSPRPGSHVQGSDPPDQPGRLTAGGPGGSTDTRTMLPAAASSCLNLDHANVSVSIDTEAHSGRIIMSVYMHILGHVQYNPIRDITAYMNKQKLLLWRISDNINEMDSNNRSIAIICPWVLGNIH